MNDRTRTWSMSRERRTALVAAALAAAAITAGFAAAVAAADESAPSRSVQAATAIEHGLIAG